MKRGWVVVGSLWLGMACSVAEVSTVAAEPEQAAKRSIDSARQWGQWRGPLGTGVAPWADPPVEWREDHNVRWKTPIPGLGHSTPVVWDGSIFLSTAVPIGPAFEPAPDLAPGAHDNLLVTQRQQFVAVAIERSTGQLLWTRILHEARPHEGGHRSGSLASASPVTDGTHLYVYFGSYGLYALDLKGTVVWQVNLGELQTKHGHGEGSGPVLHGDTLVVNWDHEGPSALVAFHAGTGQERWRVERDEVTSWATPIVVMHEGRAQVIVSGTTRIRSHDLETGALIWECGGLSHNIVASPVAGDGMVFAASSYDTKAMVAIRLDGARGDITGTDHVVWRRSKGTPYVPSPLLYEGALYFLGHYQNVLTRVDAATGDEQPGAFRVNGIFNIYASPVAAAGRIYVTDLDGTTAVISHGTEPAVLAVNHLNESVSASAAIVGSELYLRGQSHLYRISVD